MLRHMESANARAHPVPNEARVLTCALATTPIHVALRVLSDLQGAISRSEQVLCSASGTDKMKQCQVYRCSTTIIVSKIKVRPFCLPKAALNIKSRMESWQ